LAQANLEDVIGLTLGEFECLHQRRLGLVGLANDLDDFVNVQQYRLATFEDMDAVIHLAQAVLGAAGDGVEAKADPLAQNIAQRFLSRLTIGADHHQIDADTVFQRRMGEQQVTEFVLILIF
jgi:hypothetical protein